MRPVYSLCCLVFVSLAYAETPTNSSSTKLIELVAEQTLIVFSLDRDSNVYRIQFLTDELASQARAYYANRPSNVQRYNELSKELINTRSSVRFLNPRDDKEAAENKQTLFKMNEERRKFSNPTGGPVGELTRIGEDFLGIRELDSTTEYLIPLSRILDVAIPTVNAKASLNKN